MSKTNKKNKLVAATVAALSGISLLAAGFLPSATAGTTASLSGRLRMESGPPLAGSVYLYGEDINGMQQFYTAATDGSGFGLYTFPVVVPSGAAGYTLRQGPSLYSTVDGQDVLGFGATVAGILGNDVVTGIKLAADDVATGYDFSERVSLTPVSSITGKVAALNPDGTGAVTGGIGGVTITLTGRDHYGAAVNKTATSLPNGDFSFEGLPGGYGTGSYTITQAQPVGYVTRNSNLIVTPSGARLTFEENVPLGGTASISGSVLGSVLRPDVPGVVLTLKDGPTVVAMTVSDPAGGWSFTGLPVATSPDGYSITETQPAGFTDGPETIGTGISVVGVVGSDELTGIKPVAGETGINYYFRETSTLSTLTGHVYDVTSGTPVGIESITIKATQGAGTIVHYAETDVNGQYKFRDLLPGYWRIEEIQRPGLVGTANVIGSGFTGPGSLGIPASGSTDAMTMIEVGPSQDGVGYNFNNVTMASLGATGKISGKVTATGTADPVIGRLVSISGKTSSGVYLELTTSTDMNGMYSFDVPPADADGWEVEWRITDYLDGFTANNLTVVPSVGTGVSAPGVASGIFAITGINLAVGQVGEGFNFQEGRPRISGVVTEVGTGAPVPNVTVYLTTLSTTTGIPSVVFTTMTDSVGAYSFNEYPASSSSYVISEVQPEGYDDGPEIPGLSATSSTNDQIKITPINNASDFPNNNFTETLRVAPTTVAPTTVAPTTVAPTTVAPTTVAPTTVAPTTVAPTTVAPTTVAPATVAPATVAPATVAPATVAPSNIVLSKYVDGAIGVGQFQTWTLTTSNTGQGPATGPFTVIDVVQRELAIVSATGDGWDCVISGRKASCVSRQNTLASGETLPAVIIRTEQKLESKKLLNTAFVKAPSGQQVVAATGNPADDKATAILETPPLAYTGSQHESLALVGGGSLLAGLLLMSARRRKVETLR